MVRLGIAALTALLLGAVVDVAPAAAQTRPLVPPVIDAKKLGIDLSRIRRQLVRYNVREERDGNNLRYIVDVFGSAPGIDIFPSAKIDPNYWTGPAPYGAPTHRDFLNLNTPEEFRAPAADVGALVRWFAEKAKREQSKPRR